MIYVGVGVGVGVGVSLYGAMTMGLADLSNNIKLQRILKDHRLLKTLGYLASYGTIGL